METPSREALPDALAPPASRGWMRRISTQNPFYLISAAFFIHSTGFVAEGGERALSLYPRLGLIAGYLAAVVATAVFLVRRWKLWDDARSLLLTIVLLLLELSMGLDEMLARDWERGAIAALLMLGIIVGISEGVFRGLGMRLPAVYRVPYYLLWALMVLFPVTFGEAAAGRDPEQLRWHIASFSPLAAIVLLTLIPAARRGREAVGESGTPWPWPLYPWSAFVFLLLGLGLRQYALCLSFDPVLMLDARAAYAMQSLFGPYLLVPMLLAIALLFLERAVAADWRAGKIIACVLPAAAVLLAVPGENGNAARAQFVSDLTAALGSPAWIALMACILFQSLALLRGVQAAGPLLVLTLLAATVIGPETISPGTLEPVDSPGLITAGTVALVLGVTAGHAGLSITGLLCAIGAVWNMGVLVTGVLPEWIIAAHLVLAALLLVGAMLRTIGAEILQSLGALGLLVMSLAANAAGYPLPWTLAYLTAMGLIALAYGWWREEPAFSITTGLNGFLVAVRGTWAGYWWIAEQLDWRGFVSFTLALLTFVIGLWISVRKGLTNVAPAEHPRE